MMDDEIYGKAAAEVVDLGNRLMEADAESDLWDVADGLLAGAIQFWLYSRQPCGDPRCEDCAPMSTAELRTAELRELVAQFAQESEYFHTPHDTNVGRA